MSAHKPNPNTLIDALPARRVPPSVQLGSGIAMVVGLVGFAYGLVSNPAWAWGAFLVALLYTMAIAQGGVLFGVMMTLTWGRWGRPLKRISETFGFFLPFAYVLLLVFLLFGLGLYPWAEGTFTVDTPINLEPHSSFAIRTKPVWLNPTFFIVRQALGVGLLFFLSYRYMKASLRPDLVMAQARLRRAHRKEPPGWWSWFAEDPANVEDEVEESELVQSKLAVPIAMLYAVVFSMVAVDLVMSLSPWWYTNMFGGWFFVSSFWLSLCTLGVYAMLARDWLGIQEYITPKVTHDLGKLTLALTMFWAYTLFAQLLPIWYANMPEEIDFFLIRMTLPEWSWLTQAVAVLCFLAPFTMLASRGLKKMKWPYVATLCVIMVGLFLERTLLVMPSIYFEDQAPYLPLLTISVPIWIGFLGAFVGVVTRMLASIPPVPISDPKLEPHPWDVHVHALGDEGAH